MPRVDKTGHTAPRPELIAGFYRTPGCRDFASRVNAQNGGLKPLVHNGINVFFAQGNIKNPNLVDLPVERGVCSAANMPGSMRLMYKGLLAASSSDILTIYPYFRGFVRTRKRDVMPIILKVLGNINARGTTKWSAKLPDNPSLRPRKVNRDSVVPRVTRVKLKEICFDLFPILYPCHDCARIRRGSLFAKLLTNRHDVTRGAEGLLPRRRRRRPTLFFFPRGVPSTWRGYWSPP